MPVPASTYHGGDLQSLIGIDVTWTSGLRNIAATNLLAAMVFLGKNPYLRETWYLLKTAALHQSPSRLAA